MRKCEEIAFDNTMLTAYDRCPRYFWFRHVVGWTKREAALPLEFGKAWHEAMEMLYRARADGVDVPVEALQQRFIDVYDAAVPVVEQIEPRTSAHGAKMLAAYVERYRDEPIRVRRPEDVEIGFCVPLPLGDAQLVGRIDAIVDHETYGRCILEHKTASTISRTYLQTFRPNNQVTGYIFAATFYEPELRRCIVNVAQVAKTKMEFVRIPTSRTTEELEDFVQQICFKIQRIWDDVVWPMNTTSCGYYGRCLFHDLCFAGHRLEYWLEVAEGGSVPDGYVVERWHPYE